MKRNELSVIGSLIIALLIVSAIFAPFLAPYDPYEQNLDQGLKGPTYQHVLGQDKLGRDILSRIIYGARISIIVGFTTVIISASVGIVIGSLSGFSGGLADEIVMRIIDIFLAFPGILMAIAVMAVRGPGLNNVIIALCLFGWVGYARLVRAQALAIKEREYILAALALGGSTIRIIARHLVPNLISPVIVQATFGMATAILAEAGLSFLGLGTQPPQPSWGSLLNEGRQFLLIAPHLTTFPGLAIMLVTLGFNFLGDSLRDRFDPKMKD